MERVDEMTTPPVVGQFYLVPTVEGEWDRIPGVWPVIGPLHQEDSCISFPIAHYHFDLRFLPMRYWEKFGAFRFAISPLQTLPPGNPFSRGRAGMNPDGLSRPRWRRRKMLRDLPHPHPFAVPDYSRRGIASFPHCLAEEFAGKAWSVDAAGIPRCPHKGAPLGSVPEIDGVRTCPLHGLKFRNGLVVSE